MKKKLNILGICGSASNDSANLSLLKYLRELGKNSIELELLGDLSILPHFRTEFSYQNVPEKVLEFRDRVVKAEGIIICTPEYVFSIPSGLKNALEWCVSTTVFSNKPMAIISASASGVKGHEELKLIMKTLQSIFTEQTCLLIQGVKAKINNKGELSDEKTKVHLSELLESFEELVRGVYGIEGE